jgi:ubiquinone/menaquinone biosynthesis C-methylase UbiE
MSASAADQFNNVAQAYASSAVHARGPDLAWLVEALEPQASWHVLDVGTGAGHAGLAVAPSVREVVAVDIADRMLSTAAGLARERSIANITFAHGAGGALPFPDASFDGAFTRYSAHHWPDPGHGVKDIARVLRPGAPFILIDTEGFTDVALDTYVNALELLRDPSHVHNASAEVWQEYLTQAGFVVETTRRWRIDLETEGWLQRSATEDWRAAACRKLLRTAPPNARSALAITSDGGAFQLSCALIKARKV